MPRDPLWGAVLAACTEPGQSARGLWAAEMIDLLGGTFMVAHSLGIKPPSVSEWRKYGMPADKLILLAVDIERASGGRVRRWHLRPTDWHRIWPELVGTNGAPPLQQGMPDAA